MNLFAYGTLMFPLILESLTGRRFESEEVDVLRFERRALSARVYPGVVKSTGAGVRGVLWFDLDEASVEILDRYEDDRYNRETIVVPTRTRGPVPALIYVLPESAAGVAPVPWDPSEFARRHLERAASACRAFRAKWNENASNTCRTRQ